MTDRQRLIKIIIMQRAIDLHFNLSNILERKVELDLYEVTKLNESIYLDTEDVYMCGMCHPVGLHVETRGATGPGFSLLLFPVMDALCECSQLWVLAYGWSVSRSWLILLPPPPSSLKMGRVCGWGLSNRTQHDYTTSYAVICDPVFQNRWNSARICDLQPSRLNFAKMSKFATNEGINIAENPTLSAAYPHIEIYRVFLPEASILGAGAVAPPPPPTPQWKYWGGKQIVPPPPNNFDNLNNS